MISDLNDPQYEPGRSDVDSNIDFFLKFVKKKSIHDIVTIVFRFLLFHYA